MHLVVVFGPPAVGKMTVGHNRLVGEFRRRVIEEACAAELPGLVFTFVWGLELEDEGRVLEEYAAVVESSGGSVHFVELYADQQTRLGRNTTSFRIERKRSKKDTEFSQWNLLHLDANYVMNTSDVPTVGERVLAGRDYLRIDNTDLAPDEAAHRICTAFALQ